MLHKVTILMLLSFKAHAGPYFDLGLGVPLFAETSYMPDLYGILAIGYNAPLVDKVSLDASFQHRSLTGSEKGKCPHKNCYGDNVIETKLRFEW